MPQGQERSWEQGFLTLQEVAGVCPSHRFPPQLAASGSEHSVSPESPHPARLSPLRNCFITKWNMRACYILIRISRITVNLGFYFW